MDVRSRMLAALASGGRRGQELVDLVRSEDPGVSAGEAWAALVDLQDDELVEDDLALTISLTGDKVHAHWRLTDEGRAAASAPQSSST